GGRPPGARRESPRRGSRAGASRSAPAVRPRGAGTRVRTSTRALEAEQRLAHELADRAEVVAALLDDHGWKAQPAEQRSRFAIALRRDLERALGIARSRIDSERDDETFRVALARPVHEAADRGEPRLVPGAGRKRHVLRARRVLEAEEVREPAGSRVDVDRPDDHLAASGEDLLRPVAVVGVDVEHRDATGAER